MKPDPLLAQALAIIRQLERSAGTEAKRCCPMCHRYRPGPHKDDCPIAQVLREGA